MILFNICQVLIFIGDKMYVAWVLQDLEYHTLI